MRRERLLALVGALRGERQMTQTTGHPLDPAQMLPLPDVLLLVTDGEPGAMLFRYTAHGEFGGDTLHRSMTEAIEQATAEYRDALGSWVDVPEDVTDPHDFAVHYAAERLDEREW